MNSPVERADYDRYLVPAYAPAAFVPVRGEGARVWDQAGRDYVDFGSGVAVTALGHAHPALIETLNAQAHKLWHVSNNYTNEPALRLAKKLIAATFADRVFFCNSGAEANEAALKLARKAAIDEYGNDKIDIIAFSGAFHGRTFFTVSVGGQPKYSQGFGPNPLGILHVPFNDLEAVKRIVSSRTCAIIVEPVIGEGGVIPAHPEFLKGLRELATEHNASLIFDEIQSGIGRTGHLYAYQKYGVTPDILTTAKGLGGGFPIGAMLTTETLAKHFSVGAHGSTYGGNPLGCAVAETVLDLINTPTVLEEVRQKADRLATGLRAIGDKYGCFSEVRYSGLWFGCVLNSNLSARAKDFVQAGVEQGVLCLQAGPDVVRLATSLLISQAEIEDGLARLDKACAQVMKI